MKITKYRIVTYIFSLILIVFSIYNLIFNGLDLSTEFTGGTSISFVSTSDIVNIKKNIPEKDKYKIEKTDNTYIIKYEKALDSEKAESINNNLNSNLNDYSLVNLEIVQPTVGRDLIYKTLIAVSFSVIVIFIFLAYSFRSILSSITAVMAMLHDTFILLGIFSFFSYLFDAQLDLLFVTAVLTVLSFSLYDTVVIFDKIREIYKKGTFGQNYNSIINKAIELTMVRSVNNSLTSIIALYSLSLFVTGSLYWFSIALLIGVILGTYSSPFVASMLYYDFKRKFKNG